MEARSAQEANRHLMKGTPPYIGIMKLKKNIGYRYASHLLSKQFFFEKEKRLVEREGISCLEQGQ